MSSFANIMSRFSKKSTPRQKTVYNKDALIDLSTFADLHDEFSLVSSFLTKSSPLVLNLPIQPTNVKILQRDRNYAIISKEGHFAIIDSKEQVIVRDEIVKENSPLYALSLSPDQQFIYLAGEDPVIKKYSFDNFKLEKEFVGHSAKVSTVLVGNTHEWMVSAADDMEVRFWSLKDDGFVKVLYTHSGAVTKIDLSENNAFLVSVSGDATAIVYELGFVEAQESGKVLTTLHADNALTTVAFSPTNNIIAGADIKGEILLWQFGEWNLIRTYKEKTPTYSIRISKDEQIMVTGGESKHVVIWQIQNQSEHPILSLNGHTEPIRSVRITTDQQFIVSVSDDLTAIRWKIPYFEVIKNIQSCTATQFLSFGDQLVGIAGNNLDYWDSKGKKLQSKHLPERKLLYVGPENTLYIFTQVAVNDDRHTYNIQIYSLENFTEPIAVYTVICGDIVSAAVSRNKTYICLGEMYKINTYMVDANKIKLINSQLYHDGDVYKLYITPNTEFLFSAGPEDNNEVIKKLKIANMHNEKEKNELAAINNFQGKVNDMLSTEDSSKLIFVTNTELVLWSIEQEATIRKIDLEKPRTRIFYSKVVPFFYTQYDTGIDVWSSKDFDLKSCISFKGLETFAFFANETMLGVKYKGKSEVFESPMLTGRVKIIGDDVKNLEKNFFDYVRDIVSGKSTQYDHRFRNWLIMPFQMTVQHVYAYYSYEEYLRSAFLDPLLKPNQLAPYVKSAKGHTVLSVALEQDFPECAKIALKCMKNRWFSNPYSLMSVGDSLVELNNSGIDGLHKLYEFAFRPHFFDNLPSFCSDIPLPVVQYSDSLEVDSDVMLGAANTLEGTAVVFEHSCFELNLRLGSRESVDFLESLIKCKNERVFETKIVRLILQQKWQEAKYIMHLQAFLYFCYMFTLTWYSTVELDNEKFLVLPFGFNISLMLYESYQMYSGGWDYFEDIWNYIDIIRAFSFVIYSMLVWEGIMSSYSDFLVVIILASWLRGLLYFRIYFRLRYLINLIFEVFKDIPAFLVLFFYATIAFSFIFYALGDHTAYYWPLLISVYSTTLGNSDTDGYQPIQWFYYLLITMFNFIIMLNVLISILSDTYSRVKDMQEIADGKELAAMIMEVELMMFWRREDGGKEFLHVCRDENEEDEDQDKVVFGKFKTMNMICEEYQNDIGNGIKELEEMTKSIKDKNMEIDGILEEIKGRL